MKIILGSQSKGRRGVLERMGYKFEIMSSDIDEKSIRHDNPKQLTISLANAKADALIPKITEPAILITFDQVVMWNDEIREKPEDEEEAREFLRGYSSHQAKTVTAVVVTNTATGERREGVDVAKIFFSGIPESIIDKLIDGGDIFSCAGGFSIENPILKNYIEKIEGSTDSVIGLPKELTERLIKEVRG